MLFKSRRARREQREQRRFYLLPGMGGRAYFRKQRRFRIIAVVVGVLVSSLLALAMWFMNRGIPR
jgi:hypothetical protein